MSTIFSKRILNLRNKAGLTQEELSKRLNISRGTYAHYEIGKRHPDYETLCKIADFYNVSTDYLLGHNTKTNDELKDVPPEFLDLVVNSENHEILRVIKEMLDQGYSIEVIAEWLKMLGPTMAEFGKKYIRSSEKPEISIYDPNNFLTEEEKENYLQKNWVNKNDFKKEK